MSEAKAICDHMRDWWQGTEDVKRKNINFVVLLHHRVYFRRTNGLQWV